MLNYLDKNPTLKTVAIGAGAGIAAKVLFDKGANSKTASGFLNLLNGVTFNVLSKASEKIGSEQSTVVGVIFGIVVSGLYVWFNQNNANNSKTTPKETHKYKSRDTTVSVSGDHNTASAIGMKVNNSATTFNKTLTATSNIGDNTEPTSAVK